MPIPRRSTGLALGSLLALALVLILTFQVFAQAGEAGPSSRPDAGGSAQYDSPDVLNINPAFPEPERSSSKAGPAGPSSSAPLVGDPGAADLSPADRSNIHPDLPEILPDTDTPLSAGGENSSAPGSGK